MSADSANDRNNERKAMEFDALSALQEAGHRIDLLSDGQRSVFAVLTEEEVAVLNRVKRQLDAVGQDEIEVEAQDVKLV
jgi:hypothetical protein